jgi:hypothetical protein
MRFRGAPAQKGLALFTALKLEKQASKPFSGFHFVSGFLFGCTFILWILLG